MSIFSRKSVQKWTDTTTGGYSQHPRISTFNGRFALLDASKDRFPWKGDTLPVVFVAYNPHKSKIYYGSAIYDPNDPKPPLCFSDNGTAPSVNAQDPQSRSCAECRHNVFGSAQDGQGKGKACQDRKKLACFVIGDPAVGQLYEFSVPPASLGNWKNYVDKLESFATPDGDRQAGLYDVVTEIGFEEGSLFKLSFEAGAWISQVGYDETGRFLRVYQDDDDNFSAPDQGEAVAALIDRFWSETGKWQTDEIVGNNDRPYTMPQVAAPAAAPQISTPVPDQRPYAGPPGAKPSSPVTRFGTDTVGGRPDGTMGVPKPEPKRGGARPGAGRPRKEPEAISPQVADKLKTLGEQANPRSIVGKPAPFPNNGPMERHGIVQPPAPNKEIDDALRAAIDLSTE